MAGIGRALALPRSPSEWRCVEAPLAELDVVSNGDSRAGTGARPDLWQSATQAYRSRPPGGILQSATHPCAEVYAMPWILLPFLLGLGLPGTTILEAIRSDDLLEADRGYSAAAARASSVVDGLLPMFADDVLMPSPGGLVRGREAMREHLEADTLSRGMTARWTPVRAETSLDGRDGYSYGYFEMVGHGRMLPGKYIAYWRRDAAGMWKVIGYKRVPRPDGPIAMGPAGTPSPGAERIDVGETTDGAERARGVPQAAGSDRAVDPEWSGAPSFPPADVIELFEVDLEFSLRAQRGVGAAFAAYAAADGANLGGGPSIVFGRAEIGKVHGERAPGELQWQPIEGRISASGDLGFTIGTAVGRRRTATGAFEVLGSGHYLTVWRRSRSGRWEFVVDG